MTPLIRKLLIWCWGGNKGERNTDVEDHVIAAHKDTQEHQQGRRLKQVPSRI